MIGKRLGVLFIVLGVLVAVLLYVFTSTLYVEAEQLGCFGDPQCVSIDTSINTMHFAFGIVGFILALGFYFIFFYSGEKAILERLENEKNLKLGDDKFSILLRALDDNQKRILSLVREQDGLSQSTLVLRSGLSKAKVSEVLSDFEKKKLVKREKKGKVNYIFFLE